MTTLREHEARKRIEAETLAAERLEAAERAQEAEREQRELARRDAEVRRLAQQAQQRRAEARRAFEDADTDFGMLASELGFGRVDEQAVLDARQERELARARLEVWEKATAAISGHPGVVGRR